MKSDSCCRLRAFIPLAVLAFLAVLTLVVHALWNGVLVDVVPVKAVTYWQALGLLLLARILFGGWPGGRRGPGGRRRERMLAEHWESLSPEQRVKMREKMRSRCGDWPLPAWCEDSPKKPEEETKN